MKVYLLQDCSEDCGCGAGPRTVEVFSSLEGAQLGARRILQNSLAQINHARRKQNLKPIPWREITWTEDGMWGWPYNIAEMDVTP